MRRPGIRYMALFSLTAAAILLSSGCGLPEAIITGVIGAPLNSNSLPDFSRARAKAISPWARASVQVSPNGTFTLILPRGTYDVTITHPWYPELDFGRVSIAPGEAKQLPQARFADLHFLFVGVNAYSDPWIHDLQGCKADAEALAAALVKGNGGSQNILESGSYRLLTDDAATRHNIEQAIQAMLQESSSGDTLIFTFAGHGGSLERPNADLGAPDRYLAYIVPSDAQSASLATYITEDDLEEWFSGRPDVRVVFMFDSCESGAMVQALPQTPVSAQNLDLPGFVVFMGSSTSGESFEAEFEGQARGVFSHFLGSGLEEPHRADADHNGTITVSELFAYARRETVKYGRENGENQYPQFRGGDSRLPLYRYDP